MNTHRCSFQVVISILKIVRTPTKSRPEVASAAGGKCTNLQTDANLCQNHKKSLGRKRGWLWPLWANDRQSRGSHCWVTTGQSCKLFSLSDHWAISRSLPGITMRQNVCQREMAGYHEGSARAWPGWGMANRGGIWIPSSSLSIPFTLNARDC